MLLTSETALQRVHGGDKREGEGENEESASKFGGQGRRVFIDGGQ